MEESRTEAESGSHAKSVSSGREISENLKMLVREPSSTAEGIG